MKASIVTIMMLLFAAPMCVADIFDAKITELWAGRSGPDATRDWLEVTNLGDTPIDTGDIAYDDISADINVALILPSFILDPGESAIFLIDIDADDPQYPNAGAEFLAVWDMFPPDGNLNGGQADGGLSSSNPDAGNLMNLSGTIIDTFSYDPATDLGDNRVMERIGEGITEHRPAVLGENGAYESEPFNDPSTGETVLDKNGKPLLLVGSPGIFEGFMDILVGDVNCDGAVDLLDVAPFVDLLTNGGFSEKADINGDGSVDLLDVTPFVELLSGN
jgi:hypothetical protein